MRKRLLPLLLTLALLLTLSVTAFADDAARDTDAVILFTSDVHCGIDQGFGYAGLQQVRDSLLARGDDVILVDDGDNIQGEPIDPEKTYTLASHNYMLLNNGDGYTMFDGAPLLQDSVMLDNQVLINYITENLGGVIGEEYVDLTGQGRIVIVEEAP